MCRRYGVAELALFGSVLRDDFRADSDVDVLVSFGSEAHPSLLELVELREDLKDLFGTDSPYSDFFANIFGQARKGA